jgi:hypothetical protein
MKMKALGVTATTATLPTIAALLVTTALFSVSTAQADTETETAALTAPALAAPTQESIGHLKTLAPTQRKDIDEEIADARLRASTGSKSLFSIQSAYNYNGGSLETPLASDRPQLAKGQVENDPAKLTGSIAGKYRASDHDNITAGFGLGWVTPGYGGQYGQWEMPFLGYNRLFKAGPFQNVLTAQFTKYTADTSLKRGLNYEIEVDHNIVYNIGRTRWRTGCDFWVSREFYTSAGHAGIANKLAATPMLQYEFNNTYTFRTVYKGATYYSLRSNEYAYNLSEPTESTGIGISITRDIFLYPNIQWIWADLKLEKTNVALAAYVNVF